MPFSRLTITNLLVGSLLCASYTDSASVAYDIRKKGPSSDANTHGVPRTPTKIPDASTRCTYYSRTRAWFLWLYLDRYRRRSPCVPKNCKTMFF